MLRFPLLEMRRMKGEPGALTSSPMKGRSVAGTKVALVQVPGKSKFSTAYFASIPTRVTVLSISSAVLKIYARRWYCLGPYMILLPFLAHRCTHFGVPCLKRLQKLLRVYC